MAKKELSFFMLVGTFIAAPVSVALYVWSREIVGSVFHASSVDLRDLLEIKRIMQFSIMQIPFFICNVLLLKYATATRHLRVITVSAFFGLILNVGLSVMLMPRIGTAGIALATSVAMMVSSTLVLIMLMLYKHISVSDVLVVLLNWMLFLTVIVAGHFQSVPSIVVVLITYCLLLFGYLKLTNRGGGIFAAELRKKQNLLHHD